MRTRRIAIGPRPTAEASDAWVRQGDLGAGKRSEVYSARLTIDVTPALRGRIKVSAFKRDSTVAEIVRELLEREFPETSDPAS